VGAPIRAWDGPAAAVTLVIMRDDEPVMLIGESFIGEGAEAAHINTVLGCRAGPVGAAWAAALASPRPGHTAFVAVLRPGLPAKPMTLFVNKASIASAEHGVLTWGAAQAGVAGGVADAVAVSVISAADAEDLLLIAAVWVNPAARDAELVYRNNRTATREALRAGAAGTPAVADMLAGRAFPSNPYYTATSDVPATPGAPAEPGIPAAPGASAEPGIPAAPSAQATASDLPGAQ
jgi:5,6,7,8-tetrahydromethanopterin hydro-lyase